MNASLLKSTMCWRQLTNLVFICKSVNIATDLYQLSSILLCAFFSMISKHLAVLFKPVRSRLLKPAIRLVDVLMWATAGVHAVSFSRFPPIYTNRSPLPWGVRLPQRLNKYEMWRGLRGNGLMESSGEGKRGRREWGSERAHRDNDVGPGTRGDCTVKRETFCLRAVEGRRKGWRGGEVISPREHIHFTVFSSALPQDITSLFPSSDYPSIYHYICGKKPSLAHILITSVHSRSRKGSRRLPMTALGGTNRFSSAACVSLCKVNK